MQILSFRRNKATLHCRATSALLIVLLFIVPLSAFAQDTNSIDTLRQMGKAFAKISEKASPAVVGIKAEKTITQEYQVIPDWPFGEPFDPFDDDFFDRFFRRRFRRQRSPQHKYPQTAQGSGFIISADGYILTNNHLVGDADKVMVKVGENPEVEAKLIGADPDSDVAVIKIDTKKDLSYIELADSDTLEVGEWVLAIGNPFGLSHTVTAGIVSAKGRSGFGITSYENFIQTDAAINPGNSGGPLLNLDGKVVGINTFIISRGGGNMGIGFAIPINMAKDIYKELIDTGTVVRGFLGVNIQDLDPDTADLLDLDEDTKGVVLPDVTEGSAADKAGIKPYDVIIEFEGRKIKKANDLLNRVAALKPGAKVKIVVFRDGKRKTITVELGKRPPRGKITGAPPDVLEQLGLTVQELTDELAERLGYKGMTGVVVSKVEPGSEAARKGITPGTLIMEVNRSKVKNTKDFNNAIKKAAKEGKVLLRIKQERGTSLVVLKVPKK